MTEIEFHFNVPNKLHYCCRLLRKISRSQLKAVVVADAPTLAELGSALWALSPTEFIAHCRTTAAANTVRASPILLTEDAGECPASGVLINLGHSVPGQFEGFERFLELVSSDPQDRLQGRQRWKHYKDRGYLLVQHDQQASEASR
jgi:DNA polymerase III subunit chi